jgi:hypothetical protein
VGHSTELAYYVALIVVLPSTLPTGQLAASLQRIVDIIKAYRARRSDGLASLLNGSRRWFQVGVVQVLGTTDALRQPVLKSILDRVCVVRPFDNDLPVNTLDAFDIYNVQEPSTPPQPGTTNHLARSTDELWAYVTSWGIPMTHDAVSRARQCIDGCRAHYENPQFRVNHRPIEGLNRNRLDFLLDEPETQAPGHKKWMENGAGATRYVMAELHREFPNLRRPGGRGKTKGAQLALHKLYRALVALENTILSQS